MRRKLNHEVLRLHQEFPDASNSEIARMIGSLPQYVSVTLKRHGFPPARRPSFRERPKTISPRIPHEIADKFDVAAAQRCMTTNELIVALVTVIANENMVDAILDDADRLLEAAE